MILPYAGPMWPADEQVETALRRTGWEYESFDVSGSDRAYYDLLSELWAAGEAFGVVEHDIVIHTRALDELANCPNDWCGFPHEYGGTITYGLGCVKFSAELIARSPDAMIRVGVLHDPTHSKRHWCRIDSWLQGVILPDRGERKCCHKTVVGHLGTGSSHGCIF